jgi:pimeloyl-ACP methyl ester carboxylesterase
MVMKRWEDGYVEGDGIRLHYYRTGGDKPQVVLNHGAMDDGLCWTRVALDLESDYDVIMLDARGHGLSDSGRGDYTSAARAADAIKAIENLRLDRPVIGGHSMGADTSLHVAAMRPDLVKGVYMEDPPITMPGEPVFSDDLTEGKDVGKLIYRMTMVFKILPNFAVKPLAKKAMPVSPDEEIIPWLNSRKRLSMDFLNQLRTAPEDLLNASPFDILKKIAVPALLIMGDRDSGAIVSEEVAEEMKTIMPGLQVAHLAGANHDIRRAKFNDYMAALKDFITAAHKAA